MRRRAGLQGVIEALLQALEALVCDRIEQGLLVGKTPVRRGTRDPRPACRLTARDAFIGLFVQQRDGFPKQRATQVAMVAIRVRSRRRRRRDGEPASGLSIRWTTPDTTITARWRKRRCDRSSTRSTWISSAPSGRAGSPYPSWACRGRAQRQHRFARRGRRTADEWRVRGQQVRPRRLRRIASARAVAARRVRVDRVSGRGRRGRARPVEPKGGGQAAAPTRSAGQPWSNTAQRRTNKPGQAAAPGADRGARLRRRRAEVALRGRRAGHPAAAHECGPVAGPIPVGDEAAVPLGSP